MLQPIWKLLLTGWRVVTEIHTISWIAEQLGIILVPAAIITAIIGFVGEHSFAVLAVSFALLSAVSFISLLAWRGYKREATRLTRDQKRALLGEAEKGRTVMRGILIAYTDSSPATEPIARDLGEVFDRAGIAPWFGLARPDNLAHTGLILCVKDLNNPPTATESLKNALQSAKIPFVVRSFPTSGFIGSTQTVGADENLMLWVAPNLL